MANSDYQKFEGGDFTPYCLLASQLSWLTDTLKFEKLNNPLEEPIVAGDAIMIDGEVMEITGIVADTFTVKRGCADTTPKPHQPGADIWFLRSTNTTMKEYAGGDTVGIKITPFLPSGTILDLPKATPAELTFNYRFARPYPPGQMRVNGGRWYNGARLTADDSVLNMSWVHRNRVLQQDKLFGHDEAGVTLEPNVLYAFHVDNHNGVRVRDEWGVSGNSVNYTWWQAINDFGVGLHESGQDFIGQIYFEAYLPALGSWTGYHFTLTVNNRAPYEYVAGMGVQSAQASGDQGIQPAITTAMLGRQAVQSEPMPTQHTLLTAAVSEGVGQLTAFYTPLTRMLFESPYTYLLRRGLPAVTHRVSTMTARPGDRLTDNHHVYSRNNSTNPWEQRDYPPFTPWLIIDEPLPFLTDMAKIRTSSITDGVILDDVRPGQLAALNGELVRVVDVTMEYVKVARGCADTVPNSHPAGSRIWFFEAAGGLSRLDTTWGSADLVESKIVPAVYGPALDPAVAKSDSIEMQTRVTRPFPPGQVKVDGLPWFNGARMEPGKVAVLTWAQRNRLSQGTAVLDHNAPQIAHEYGTTYRLKIALKLPGANGKKVEVIIREEMVDGTTWSYTYDKAVADGRRAAQILDVCGFVVVPLYLDAMRDGQENWQGYSIPLVLPAPVCPINKPPGGGQGPSPETPGGGPGGGTGGGSEPGGGGQQPGTEEPNPPDPKPPLIPETWPPVPPDPIDPQQPGEPNPGDTDPEPGDTGEHWDFTWDIHWDAFRRNGGNNQGEG